MSQTKHTPEPWANGNAKLKADGADILLDYGHYRAHIGRIISIGENDEKIAARIVSCVNAMSGIDNPDEYMQGVNLLEKRYYQEQEDKATYRRQRDQLYRMCEELWQNLNGFNIDPDYFSQDVAQVLKNNNPSTVVDPDQIHPLQPLNQQS